MKNKTITPYFATQSFEGPMIVQNCLELLKSLSQIEDDIRRLKELGQRWEVEINADETLVRLLVEAKREREGHK